MSRLLLGQRWRSSSSSAACSSRSCRATPCCSRSASSSPAGTRHPLVVAIPASPQPAAFSATSPATRSAGPSGHRCASATDGSSEEVLRPDPRLLREARRQGAGHRPLRADRAHLHHASWPGSAGWTAGTSSSGRRRRGAVGRPRLTLLGYFLGGVHVIRDNLEAAILLIVPLGAADGLEFLEHRSRAKAVPPSRGHDGGHRGRPRRHPLTRSTPPGAAPSVARQLEQP